MRVSELQPSAAEQTPLPDPRFASPDFREAVKIVLNYFGLPATFGSFKKHDRRYKSGGPYIDWHAVCRRILTPEFTAECYILNANPTILPVGRISQGGGFVKTVVPISALTRAKALEKINNKRYEFIRWI